MTDKENAVVSALLVALEASPDDQALLLHIAGCYLDDGAAGKALIYLQRILAKDPVHIEALQHAHRAATADNQTSLAQGYHTLLTSLGKPLDEGSNVSSVHQASSSVVSGESPPRIRGAKLRLISNEKDEASDWLDVEDSNIYMDDVSGMEDVKRRLNLAFLTPLKNPEVMKAYGKKLAGGLMLYGPPGCGKTFIARALAGELGAKFISVGMTDILDMYIGESERKLHEIFESARRHAPAVLFFDELDALGQKRSQLRNTGLRGLVNQLLAEMDSVNSDNEGLFILAATNHPWDVDTALRRPGRFDRIVAVFPPDAQARRSMLHYYLQQKPSENVDVELLAKRTEQYSGADLRYLCDVAAEYAIEKSLETGDIHPLTTQDFERPLKEVKPSTRGWFETARNFAMFANESGDYDDLLNYIRQHKL